MAVHFNTFGPFELKRKAGVVDHPSVVDLWHQLNDEKKGLYKGVGVYVIATKNSTGLIPWYVGKSDTGFKHRLSEKHHAFELIKAQAPKGNLYIFLFAKVTAKRASLNKPPKKRMVVVDDESDKFDDVDELRGRRKPRKSIGKLEFLLIGSCLVRNPNLVNAKEKSFHSGLVVPGFLNYERTEVSEPVSNLRKMFEG